VNVTAIDIWDYCDWQKLGEGSICE
jgi:hypothetical protein